MSVRILLIDDHSIVRAGLRAVLEAEADFEVVGQADNGTRGVFLAQRLRPAVVVTDLLLPDLDGVSVTERIRAQIPETHVVILTSVSEQDQWVVRAIQAGAVGYVMKSANVAQLVQTIRQAAQGQVYLSSRVAVRLMQEVRASHRVTLTDRERRSCGKLRWAGRIRKSLEHWRLD